MRRKDELSESIPTHESDFLCLVTKLGSTTTLVSSSRMTVRVTGCHIPDYSYHSRGRPSFWCSFLLHLRRHTSPIRKSSSDMPSSKIASPLDRHLQSQYPMTVQA